MQLHALALLVLYYHVCVTIDVATGFAFGPRAPSFQPGTTNAKASSAAAKSGKLHVRGVASSLAAQSPDNNQETFTVRDCQYSELGAVADIIIASFYKDKVAWKSLFRLAELNRLQINFARPDQYEEHRMFVAVAKDDSGADIITGFCDIDARPCRTNPPLPRPYLSDLSVAPDFRRRGIAKSLVQASEDFLPQNSYSDLYIRVQESNEAAAAMYRQLQYVVREKQHDPSLGSVLLLYKNLEGNASDPDSREDDYILDYVEP